MVLRREPPAGQDRDFHDLEEIRRDHKTVDALPAVARGRVHAAAYEDARRVDAAGEERGIRQRRRAHSGHGRDPFEQPAVQRSRLFFVIPVQLRLYPKQQQIVRVESDVDVPEILQRPEKQPRAHEEHERDGHLGDEQRPAQDALRGCNAARVLFERGAHVAARRAEGGRDAEDNAGHEGDAEHEHEHAPVQQRRLPLGTRQQLFAPVAHENAEAAADRREQQAFGQQLANHPQPRRTEREPDRQFLLTRRRAGEQQVRDIRADDQQHQKDDDAENRRGPQLARTDVVDSAAARFDLQTRDFGPGSVRHRSPFELRQ